MGGLCLSFLSGSGYRGFELLGGLIKILILIFKKLPGEWSDQKIKKDREKIKIGAKNLSAPDQKV